MSTIYQDIWREINIKEHRLGIAKELLAACSVFDGGVVEFKKSASFWLKANKGCILINVDPDGGVGFNFCTEDRLCMMATSGNDYFKEELISGAGDIIILRRHIIPVQEGNISEVSLRLNELILETNI